MWSYRGPFKPKSSLLPVLWMAFSLGALLPNLAGTPKPPAPAVGETAKLPIGTVLPVTLEHALSSKNLVKGEALEARLMQDVPLPNKEKIPAGSKILGSVVNVVSAEDGPSSITFRFVSLESKHMAATPLVVGLRAMATFEAAQTAQTPYQDATSGTNAWATTLQIGGDVRYGDGGKVSNRHHRQVGKATTDGGVLVRVEDPPGSPCAGWPGAASTTQALWLFSADACGLYDMKHIRLLHAGNKEPLGDITLSRDDGEIKLMKSSVLLLRVVR
jgi:hypothetical protein